MGQDPAFPWYASDWLGSNRRAMMTLEQQGAYMNLLCRQWTDPTCSLPDDDDALANLSELGERWLKGSSKVVRDCFPKHPSLEGRIANSRMLEIHQERVDWRDKCRAGGLKSAEVRRAKSKGKRTSGKEKGSLTTLSTTLASKRQLNGNTPSPSPSPSYKTKEEPIGSSFCDAPPEPSPPAAKSPFSFPLKGGKLWDLSQRKFDEYLATYGAHLDVPFQMAKAKQWLMDHPDRRKTARGMAAFLTGWLNRADDNTPPTDQKGRKQVDFDDLKLGDERDDRE